MRHQDNRLPDGISIFENGSGEFVAVDNAGVVFFDRDMVKAGATLDEAVNYYLNKVIA